MNGIYLSLIELFVVLVLRVVPMVIIVKTFIYIRWSAIPSTHCS